MKLEKARGDAKALKQLLAGEDMPDWPIGFHAQQAIEKAIKAVLSSSGIEYPFTHNLVRLTAMLTEHGIPLPPDSDHFANLTPFGATLRYEEHSLITNPAPSLDRAKVLALVDRTIAWAEKRLAGPGL